MRHRYILLLILAIFFTAKVFGQVPAPSRGESQNRVLQDMSQRTGQTIGINSLSSQQWYFGTYDYVRNLGCPIAPQSPTTGGNWQRFEFTYNAFTYVYLISDNLEVLILCNESALPTAIPATQISITATPLATSLPPPTISGSGQTGGGFAQATATVQGSGQEGGGFANTTICPLAPRLQVGSSGRVTPGDANWLHSEARRNSSKIGEIPAATVFTVLEGPVCDALTNMNYWQVDASGLVAWTSEGLNGEYWLEPYVIGIVPENVSSITVADWLSQYSQDGDYLFDISPSGEFIALTNEALQIEVYRLADNNHYTQISYMQAISVLEFSESGNYLSVGTDDGNFSLVLIIPESRVIANLHHEGAIQAVTMNNSETLLVVADDARILTFWDINNSDAPLRRIELPSVAGDLEFNQDSSVLLVRDRRGKLITALTVPNP